MWPLMTQGFVSLVLTTFEQFLSIIRPYLKMNGPRFNRQSIIQYNYRGVYP